MSTHYEGSDLEALQGLRRYPAWLVERLGPALRGRVLEFGAGLGTFTRAWRARADEAVLLEPSQLAGPLAERFADDPRVSVHRETLQAHLARVGPGGFDAVVSSNVLEHIGDDVGALRAARRLLRPGGAVLIVVPALPVLFGTLDQVVGHHRRYTRRGLHDVLLGAGFVDPHIQALDLPGVLPWLVAGRVLRRRTFSRRAAILYDRAVVPVARRLEARLPPPVGKNLVARALAPPGES